jgi:hypothetical protein
MNEPFVNLNLIGVIAMTTCIVAVPFWLLGAISGKLFLSMIVFFVGMVWLSNRADEGL